jgi:hypothetical protein
LADWLSPSSRPLDGHHSAKWTEQNSAGAERTTAPCCLLSWHLPAGLNSSPTLIISSDSVVSCNQLHCSKGIAYYFPDYLTTADDIFTHIRTIKVQHDQPINVWEVSRSADCHPAMGWRNRISQITHDTLGGLSGMWPYQYCSPLSQLTFSLCLVGDVSCLQVCHP